MLAVVVNLRRPNRMRGRSERLGRYILLPVATIAATMACAIAASAANHANGWYWSPGACKAMLAHGVVLGDGRTFYPSRSYCIGSTGCAWNKAQTKRLYSGFYTIMRSYDGAVRTMTLTVTGRDTFSGSRVILRYTFMTAGKFAAYNNDVATAAAKLINEHGCKFGVFG